MTRAWQALGGGNLEGTRLVRLVYLDEAGMSNPAQEPIVAVAGVIVHADNQLEPLEKALASIVEKHIPVGQRENFVFHATELFNGGGKVFKREVWPLEKRLAIADEIAALPASLNLRIAVAWMKRDEIHTRFGFSTSLTRHQKSIAALTGVYLMASSTIEQWMRQEAEDEVCLLVAEDLPDARSAIRRAQQDFKQPGGFSGETNLYFPFTRIKESTLFQDKTQSPPLQLADFCAYTWKRWAMDNISRDSKWRRFINPMQDFIASYDEKKQTGKHYPSNPV